MPILTESPASSSGLPLGLPGATVPTRYVGATTGSAPVTGTFAVGDFVVDTDGFVRVCTVAGSPGTWVRVGAPQGSPTNPGAPAATTSTTPVMMGLAVTSVALTTRLMMTAVFNIRNQTAGFGANARFVYGTGTPPVNGAAATGTGTGSVATQVGTNATSPGANVYVPATTFGFVSGLTIGTTYWVDAQVSALGGGTAQIANITVFMLWQ